VGAAWIAVAAVMLYRQRRGALLPFLATSLPPLLGWFLWSETMRPSDPGSLFAYYTSYAHDWIGVSLLDVPVIVVKNILLSVSGLGWLLLSGPVLFSSFIHPLIPVIYAGGLAISAAALLRGWLLAKKRRALPWLLGIYLLPILFHPWPPHRFLVPISVLVCALFIEELMDLAKRFMPQRLSTMSYLAFLVVVLNICFLTLTHNHVMKYKYPVVPGLSPPRWESLRQGYAWLRSNTSPDAIVASGLDPMIWLYADRRSFRYYTQMPIALFYSTSREKLEPPDKLLENMRSNGAGFLFEAPQYGFEIDRYLRERISFLAEQHPPPIIPVFISEDGDVRIYRILPRD